MGWVVIPAMVACVGAECPTFAEEPGAAEPEAAEPAAPTDPPDTVEALGADTDIL